MPPTSMVDSVPVENIQKALDDSGLTQSEVARRMGWFRTQPDIARVRRAIGKHPSGGTRPLQKHVTYDRAVLIVEAMGLDPVDYGM